ncbi:AP-2 complex subunit sigma [Ascosphaera aggregata]|nr:AP-2 complex subunit sigma [Ascosphaera aggregata]
MAETYVLYGFRWYRAASSKAFGIRAYVTYHDILDAASEYLQEPLTNRCVIKSFEKINPDILNFLPDMRLIEQYDPEDTSPAAVSQPYAYVAAKTIVMGEKGKRGGSLSLSIEEVIEQGPGLSQKASEALSELRDTLAPDSRKTRLAKWYAPYTDDEKVRLKGEVHRLVAPRDQKYQSNFVEFKRSTKIVYRRYAGLFFCVCVDANDNELAYLEAIHFFVEVLDQFFGNVCELDLVFNFYKVYAILDEVFLAGEIEETSKHVVLTRLEQLDKLE